MSEMLLRTIQFTNVINFLRVDITTFHNLLTH